MSANIKQVERLSEIADDFDALLCDIWGVLHDGVKTFKSAVEAITRFKDTGKPVVLVTNAARPKSYVQAALLEFGITSKTYDSIVTTGEVFRSTFDQTKSARLFHIGQERDKDVFSGMDVVLADEKTAEKIVCTGLFDPDHEEAREYHALFTRLIHRNMELLCLNPDKSFSFGGKRFPCAGALAEYYVELGGIVHLIGKPHQLIYKFALNELDKFSKAELKQDRILAIGDTINTDLMGAANAKIQFLFVNTGVDQIKTTESAIKQLTDEIKIIDRKLAHVRGFAEKLKW